MKKMTIWPAAAAALLLTAAGVTYAASAAELTQTKPTASPTASETTASPGTATIELAEDSGAPGEGATSTTDDTEEFVGDVMEPIRPLVELIGALDGDTFNGAVQVDASAASGPLDRIAIEVELMLLLENGKSFPLYFVPTEKSGLGIDNVQTVQVSFDLSEIVNRWEAEGQTVRVDGADVLIASVSNVVQVTVHPSYIDTNPEIGLSGFQGNTLRLTR